MDWKRESGRDFNLTSTQTSEDIGPGSYNIESSKKTPSASKVAFGSTIERDLNLCDHEITPAPGSYDDPAPSSRSTSSVFHSSTKRVVFKGTENPSPADYSHIESWCPQRHIKVKAKVKQIYDDSPNFGQDVNGYVERGDGTLRAVKKVFKDATYIAPGTYDPDDRPSSRAHQMKETYRDISFVDGETTPGPGAYSPEVSKTKMKSQIRAKQYTVSLEPPLSGNMGHTQWAKDKRPSSNFSSRSKREVFSEQNDTPAPNAYQRTRYKKTKSSTAGFGQRSSRFRESKDYTPGPGRYESKPVEWVHQVNRTKGTIRSKSSRRRGDDDTPGPGSYNISPVWGDNKRKSTTFGRAKRRGPEERCGTPGPGSYDIDRSMTVRGMEMHSSRLDHGSIFTIPTRDTPAPGSYGSKSSLSSRGYSIPRGDRFSSRSSDTPGPGSYEVRPESMLKRSYNVDYLNMKR